MEYIIVVLLAVILIVNVILLLRKGEGNGAFDTDMKSSVDALDKSILRIEASVKEEIARSREEMNRQNKSQREELSASINSFGNAIASRIAEGTGFQKTQLMDFSKLQKELNTNIETRLEGIRNIVEEKLKVLQEENSKKLEEMRQTVDEKLHTTLEKRLTQSFQLVSERLDKVALGLGEMQSLAAGVGDLKKVLTNVKARGMLGEYQLESLLEQILSPDQYAKNVKTNPATHDLVEFAIKLPGKDDAGKCVWLPVDSKFPIEDYNSLVNAYELGDIKQIDELKKTLVNVIKKCAKDIRSKYISPPETTDFGIMFLPFESLYAEVLRNPGLFESLQNEYKITITGPTTLAAFLNSLQMGFRTLAIEKRSSEVWNVLAAVKTDFHNFSEILAKTQKKLQEASNVIDSAGTKSRAIERKLRDVQALPKADAENLLGEDTIEQSYRE